MSPDSTDIAVDQDVRDRVLTTLDKNVVIVAGAGAGKTTALISRMIALVSEKGVDPSSIAAITFTRKAAGELRNRFIGALRDAVREESNQERRSALKNALLNSDATFTGTIHSFCSQLLRERSFAVGLQPDFVEIDERDERILRRRCWNSYLHSLELAGDQRLRDVQELRIGVNRLYQFFSEANEFRDIALKSSEVEIPDLQPAVDAAIAFIENLDPIIPSEWSHERDPLMKAYHSARNYLRYRSLSSTPDKVEFLKIIDVVSYSKMKPDLWLDPVRISELKKSGFKSFRDELIRPALQAWGEYVYGQILPLINGAVVFYEEYRRLQGYVSFDDLLFFATRLLRESREARIHFGNRFQHLFVDEFQDTDPIQAELMLLLCASNPDTTDWRLVKPRPGSLCIVGDEKQAIYRFRRADVETFRFTARRIVETGGERLELTTSFRSLGNLCDWNNNVFSGILADGNDKYQAEFLPLEKFRAQGADDFGVRRINVPPVHRNNAVQIAEHEAEQIAGFIDAAIAGKSSVNGDLTDAPLGVKARPGDFLLLTRKNANLHIYAAELQKRGIPFDIVGGTPLGTSDDLKDLVHFLRVIYEPDNPLWMLSYLRGKLNGFNDDELYTFIRTGGRMHINSATPDCSDPVLQRRFLGALERARACRKILTGYPPLTAIEMVVDALGIASFSATYRDGSTRAGTIIRVLELVRMYEKQGLHWGEILEELEGLIEDPQANLFESTLETGRQDVVRLMNIHQCKGLQARAVILADSYNHVKQGVSRHVSRMSDPPYVSIRVTERKTGYELVISQPPGWAEDAEEEERFQAAEEDRLRYVAATRAQNLLVVCVYPKVRDRGQWSAFYNALEKVPVLEDEIESTRSAGSTQTRPPEVILRDRDLAVHHSQNPSYEIRTVSDLVEDNEYQVDDPHGYGADYGVTVHRFLELEIKGRVPSDVATAAESFCSSESALPGWAPRLAAAVERYRASDLSRDVLAADHVYCEVPVGYPDKSTSTISRGKIDLIYGSASGWTIVDHKSVVVSTDDDRRYVRDTYGPQLGAYKKFWEEATSQPVVQCGVWLTETGEYIPLENTSESAELV